MGGLLEGDKPHHLTFEQGRGWQWAGRTPAAPSRDSSEGEDGSVLEVGRSPLPHDSSEREGQGWVERHESPSVSRFKQERGWWRVGKEETLRLTIRVRGGGSKDTKAPSVLCFERGREMVVGWKKETPLRLAFRAREGDGGGLERRKPPPSRVSSEGGDGWKEGTPSILCFE